MTIKYQYRKRHVHVLSIKRLNLTADYEKFLSSITCRKNWKRIKHSRTASGIET